MSAVAHFDQPVEGLEFHDVTFRNSQRSVNSFEEFYEVFYFWIFKHFVIEVKHDKHSLYGRNIISLTCEQRFAALQDIP